MSSVNQFISRLALEPLEEDKKNFDYLNIKDEKSFKKGYRAKSSLNKNRKSR